MGESRKRPLASNETSAKKKNTEKGGARIAEPTYTFLGICGGGSTQAHRIILS
jgi:hypothetical protein